MAEHRDTPEQPYTVHDDVDAVPAASEPTAEPTTGSTTEPVATAGAPGAFEAPAAAGPHGTLTAPEPPQMPDAPAAPTRRRGGPDPVGLVAGIVALAVAILALTDTLTAVDARWALAGGAILVGVAVLAAASRPRSRPDR